MPAPDRLTLPAAGEHRVLAGADGACIAADVFGSGRPVLLLHGAGQTRGSWRRTAERLAEAGYQAVTLDLRGHGESDWSKTGYGLDLFVGDLRSVAAGFASPPALIGASLGGMVSLMATGEGVAAPALVLVDIALRTKASGRDAIQAFMGAHPDGFDSLEAAADAVSRYMPHRPRPKDVSGLRKNLREGADGRLRWHWDPTLFHQAATADGMQDVWTRLDAAAARLAAPTLLVWGSRSEIVDQAAVDHFRQVAPAAEVQVVEGARHMVAGDANTPFADAVLDFLGRVYPP
jgi:non-heme chloroperoxidase